MNTPHVAALLLDMQRDFLASSGAKMPVGEEEANRVIEAANAVLDGRALVGALPVLVRNEFRRTDWLGNLIRHGAAVAGSPGAAIDERLHVKPNIMVFPKSAGSAFSNPSLAKYLAANSISKVFLLGVFAEGCIRATAVDAVKCGLEATVPACAVGTNSEAKRRFAMWAMRRAGVKVIPSLPENAA